jgi:hypothetical protein
MVLYPNMLGDGQLCMSMMHRPRRTAAGFDDDACDRVGDVGWKEIPAPYYRVLDQDFDT